MKKYNFQKIEPKWQKKWCEKKLYVHRDEPDKEKFYMLDMFPYPSGDGLHMGHTESYTASDIVYRFKKMQGFDVLHPQGFDSFGLPAENYAIKTGVHPAKTIEKNTKNYIKQMRLLGLGHDLDHLAYTSKPLYYKWTQFLFGKFFENGLVERKTDVINWCPSCNTGIANEQVENGKCERCKTEIEQKEIPGWFFKITDFADELIKDLDKVDWPEHTIKNQRAWIGKSEGASIKFQISELRSQLSDESSNDKKPREDFLIMHGWEDDSQSGFIPWIKEALENNGHRVFAFDAPNTDEPNFDEWHEFMEEKIKEHDLKNFSIIGHSMGGHLALKLAEKYRLNRLVLIAPVGFKKSNSEYFKQFANKLSKAELDIFKKYQDRGLDIQKVKDNVNKIDFIFGEKDEWITEEIVKYYSDNFKSSANIQVLKRYGHMSESEGVKEIEEIEALFDDENSNEQKPNVVLMHGKDTDPNEKWYPWFAGEMKKNNIKFIAPILPNADDPEIGEWMNELEKTKPDKNSILVGHSRGGVAILRWLEKQSDDFRIKKVILVATNSGCSEKRTKTENNKGFFTKDGYNFEKIKKHCDNFVVLHSKDDKWVSFEAGRENAIGLEAKFLKFGNKGHFGHKLKKQEIPELLDEILPTNIDIFTTRPDTLFGATYMVIAPEHELVHNLKSEIENFDEVVEYIKKAKNKTEMERIENKEKTGVELKGVKAVNPANKEEIPIFVADYVLSGYGTGAIMAVPAHDERDWEFAKKYNIPIKQVIAQYIEDDPHSDAITEEREVVTAIVKNSKNNTYLLLDWKTTDWRSFPTGGIDGQDPVEAAKREVLEETGYKNLKFIKKIEKTIFAKFYRPHKNSNVKAHFHYLIFELENDEHVKVDDKEKEQHTFVWLKEKNVANFINVENQQIIWNEYLSGEQVFAGDGIMTNSEKFDGMNSEKAKRTITEFVGGEMTSNYRLRDWSFSRQRYWGCPIPIVYSPKGEAKFVGEKNLPWLLPKDVDFVPTGTAPLAKSKELKERTKKLFGNGWTPEVDTMDTFADSSWYFLRYPDTENKKEFCSKKKLKRWLPVDLYIGGAEHTYMHLLYARFFVKAMKKSGLINFDEPFEKLRHQGMVLDKNGVKMSKSKGNVTNPNDVVKKFGADATRMYMMFAGPLEDEIIFNEKDMKGVFRFLEKIWRVFEQSKFMKCGAGRCKDISKDIPPLFHKTIKKVTEDIENLNFNTAISQMMIFMNKVAKHDTLPVSAMEKFLVLLSPFAPHIAEELWEKLGHKESIFLQTWPEYDARMIKEEIIEMVVQINGKLRDKVQVSADISENEVKEKVLARKKIQKYIGDKKIKKIIFVKGKLLSVVI